MTGEQTFHSCLDLAEALGVDRDEIVGELQRGRVRGMKRAGVYLIPRDEFVRVVAERAPDVTVAAPEPMAQEPEVPFRAMRTAAELGHRLGKPRTWVDDHIRFRNIDIKKCMPHANSWLIAEDEFQRVVAMWGDGNMPP